MVHAVLLLLPLTLFQSWVPFLLKTYAKRGPSIPKSVRLAQLYLRSMYSAVCYQAGIARAS